MAKVTVVETSAEVLICLHLPLNATLPGRESFVSSLRALLTLEPSESLRMLPGGLSGGPRRAQRALPSRVEGPPQPAPVIQSLVRSLGKHPLGSFIASASGAVASALGLEQESVSEFLAERSGTSTAEVHLALGAPFFGVPGATGALTETIVENAKMLARDGDVEGVQRLLRASERMVSNPRSILGTGIGSGFFVRASKKLVKQLEPVVDGAMRVRDRQLEQK